MMALLDNDVPGQEGRNRLNRESVIDYNIGYNINKIPTQNNMQK